MAGRGPGNDAPRICGLGLASVMGLGEEEHIRSIRSGLTVFRPLGALHGEGHPWSPVKGAWLQDRSHLAGRRQGPASQLALNLARQAVDDAGWGKAELEECAIVLGSSRGNAAGWLDPWPGRRRVGLLSAPNSLHSELASTVSIELGIQGPYHVLSSGCAAGLDAVGIASMLIRTGTVKRALAIGLDLPLTPGLLDTYWASHMLSLHGMNDPYHPDADGMIIGEGGAALALCAAGLQDGVSRGCVIDYRSNSDAWNPLGMKPDGERLGALIGQGLERLSEREWNGRGLVLCPHASGTHGNAVSECAAWQKAFAGQAMPDVRMLKPYVGHTIGGSGILELALLVAFAGRGCLPPNPQGLTPPPGLRVSYGEDPLPSSGLLMKTAASMGGHNALVTIRVGEE